MVQASTRRTVNKNIGKELGTANHLESYLQGPVGIWKRTVNRKQLDFFTYFVCISCSLDV